MKRQESLSQQMNEKEGKLFKRGGRMFRWTSRYFTMQGPKLIYKLNQTSTNIRGDFDLAPGCMVTEITEDYIGTIKGKRIFVFWVVWPHDKHHKYIDIDNTEMMKEGEGDESDDEDAEIKDTTTGNNNNNTTATNNNINNNNTLKSSTSSNNNNNNNNNHERAPLNRNNSQQKSKNKDLVDIIKSEKLYQQEKAAKAAEQIERHQIHDKNISVGAKVAAFAVGGVFVGVFTAGIGLIPYVTVAALAAVAGGGVVALQVRTQYKRPSDSRLVLACDTMNDAIAWKIAIEYQITKLDKKAAILPANSNPLVISSIIGLSQGEGFQRFEIFEGMRILAMETPLMSATGGSTISASGSVTMENTQCMKAQLVVHATPFAAFLAVMDGNNWPAEGNVKVLKSIDDHADVIEVEVMSDCRKYGGREFIKRKLCFTRFWKLDDDGIYLIALNSTPETTMSEDEMEVEEVVVVGGGESEDIITDSTDVVAITATTATTTHAKSKPIKKQHKQIKEQKKSSSSLHPVTVDAVITISPRKDNNEFDINETLVKCTCQVSTTGWEKGEMETFMTDFLKQHLLELNQHLLSRRFPMHIPPPTPSSQQQSLLLSNDMNNNIAGAVAHALNTSQESDVSNYTNNNSNHNTFSSPSDNNNTNNNYSNNNSSHNSSFSLPKRNSLSVALTSISTPSTTATAAGTSAGGMSSYHSLSSPLHDNRSHSNSNSPKRFSSSSFGVTTKQPHNTTTGDYNANINDINNNSTNATNSVQQQQKSTKSRRFMFRISKSTAVDDSYLYGGSNNGVNINNDVINANFYNNNGSYGMDNNSNNIPSFNSNDNNNDDNATTTISSSGRYIAAANYSNNNNHHHRRATSLSPSLHTSDNMIVQLPLQPINNNNSRNYNNIHSNNHNNTNVTSINANNTANNNNNTNIDYKKNQKLHNRARRKEANQLRDSIAMKEYTLKRIQKDVLRESQQHQLILSQQLQQQQQQLQPQQQGHTKVPSSFSSSLSSSATTAGAAAIAGVGAISNGLENSLNYTSTAIVELNDSATSLMQEINKLKTEYFNSTGKPFELSVFDRTKRSSIKRQYSNNVATGNIPSSSAKQFSVSGSSNRSGFRSFRMSTDRAFLSENRDSYLINNNNVNEQQLLPQKQQCVTLNSIANSITGDNNKQSALTTSIANNNNNTGTPFHWSLPRRSLRFDMLYDEDNVNNNNNVNNDNDNNRRYFSSYIKNDNANSNNITANAATSIASTIQDVNTPNSTRARSDTVDINAKNELMVTFWLMFWIFLCVVATLFFSKFLSSF